jgi:hypothetical protein
MFVFDAPRAMTDRYKATYAANYRLFNGVYCPSPYGRRVKWRHLPLLAGFFLTTIPQYAEESITLLQNVCEFPLG